MDKYQNIRNCLEKVRSLQNDLEELDSQYGKMDINILNNKIEIEDLKSRLKFLEDSNSTLYNENQILKAENERLKHANLAHSCGEECSCKRDNEPKPIIKTSDNTKEYKPSIDFDEIAGPKWYFFDDQDNKNDNLENKSLIKDDSKENNIKDTLKDDEPKKEPAPTIKVYKTDSKNEIKDKPKVTTDEIKKPLDKTYKKFSMRELLYEQIEYRINHFKTLYDNVIIDKSILKDADNYEVGENLDLHDHRWIILKDEGDKFILYHLKAHEIKNYLNTFYPNGVFRYNDKKKYYPRRNIFDFPFESPFF